MEGTIWMLVEFKIREPNLDQPVHKANCFTICHLLDSLVASIGIDIIDWSPRILSTKDKLLQYYKLLCGEAVNEIHWPVMEPGPPTWMAIILPLHNLCTIQAWTLAFLLYRNQLEMGLFDIFMFKLIFPDISELKNVKPQCHVGGGHKQISRLTATGHCNGVRYMPSGSRWGSAETRSVLVIVAHAIEHSNSHSRAYLLLSCTDGMAASQY